MAAKDLHLQVCAPCWALCIYRSPVSLARFSAASALRNSTSAKRHAGELRASGRMWRIVEEHLHALAADGVFAEAKGF